MAVTLNSLITALDPVAVTGNRKADVESLCTDSRQVRPGSVFAALTGTREDGWRYVEDALRRGAIAVISTHAVPRLATGVCHIQVLDAAAAAGRAAALVNGEPSSRMTMIAVTGTNGKTTTACLIRDILKAAGHATGLIGTVQYDIGSRSIPAARTTPDAATLQPLLRQMVEIGCTHCVMEVSSHAIVQQRIAGITFDYAVFTNLTRDHLDYHGTMEAYFEAKATLFRSLPAAACAMINRDDDWGRRLIEGPLDASILSYGLMPDNDGNRPGGMGVPPMTHGQDARATQLDIRAEMPVLSASGAAFTVHTPQGTTALRTQLLGRFNLYNALAAVGVTAAAGVPLDTIAGALADLKGAPGRLEPVPTGRGFHVFVDYAHTDDALRNVLTALRELTRGRLIVVFGCGGNRDASKRPAMGAVAAALADRVIITSDNPRREDPETIIRDILAGIEDRRHVVTVAARAEAIAAAVGEARDGDMVLIAGKGHERVQEFADRAVPFDDRQKVREALHAAH